MCVVTRKTPVLLEGEEQSPWRRWFRANANDAAASGSADPRNDATANATTVRGRRRLKSSLYFAFLTLLSHATRATTTVTVVEAFSAGKSLSGLSQRKHEWIERSVQYYSTVMRRDYAGGAAVPTLGTRNLPAVDDDGAIVPPLDAFVSASVIVVVLGARQRRRRRYER